MEYLDMILAVAAGLLTAIPLVVKLVQYVQAVGREKNWPTLMALIMDYMEMAEELFVDGADKKAWCLGMLNTSANVVNFEIDLDVVSQMIDTLCAMSKVVNAPQSADALVAEEATNESGD